MSDLAVFSFETNELRALNVEGTPLFVAKDAASALGYRNTTQAVLDHCKRAKPLNSIGVAIHDPQKNQALSNLDPQTKLIPESDLYRLILRSNLESAERFQDWVTEEVLPEIRKTGSYAMVSAPQGGSALQRVESDLTRVHALTAQNDESIAYLNSQVFALRNHIITLEKEIALIREQVSSAGYTLDTMTISGLRADNKLLKTAYEDFESRIQDMEPKVETLVLKARGIHTDHNGQPIYV